MLTVCKNNKTKLEEADKVAILSDTAKEKHLNTVYQTLTQYFMHIRLHILGLRELLSFHTNSNAFQFLKELDQKSSDILNAAFADDEKKFFDINILLTECQMIYLKEAFKNEINIEVCHQELPLYYGDQLKLKQILLSIIGKCLQCVSAEGRIYVKTSTFVEQEKTFIKITICDNGFPEKTIQRTERTLGIDQMTQVAGLTILSLENVQNIVQEEGDLFKILSNNFGRKYALILNSTCFNDFRQKDVYKNNIISFNNHRNR